VEEGINLKIDDLTKNKKTFLPVNKVLFPNNEQQKWFIRVIFIVSVIIIAHFWVIDIYKYTTGKLVIDRLFWFRQVSAVMVLLHAIALIVYFDNSIVLFSLSIFMNASIIYLSLFTDFFPIDAFILLTLAPTIFIAVYYERKFSMWYITITCLVILAGYVLFLDISHMWNALLVVFSFAMIFLASFLQNPSIKLMRTAHQVWEKQYVQMLKFVYDAVLICDGYLILDADTGFYNLFQISNQERTLLLKDFLPADSQEYVYAELKKTDTNIIQTLGRRKDGIVFPITLYILNQTVGGRNYSIITIHDATKQLGSEYSLQRKNKELTTINHISKAINSSLSLGEVLNTILEESKNIYSSRFSAIWLYEDKKAEFICVNARGTNASIKIGLYHERDCSVFSRLIQDQTPYVIDQVQKSEVAKHIKEMDHGFEVQTMLALPIIFQGQLIGVMQFLDDKEHLMNKGDLDVLMSIASNSAVAIMHARQFERMASDQQRWRTLQLISQKINACLQPKDIFRVIASSIDDILTYDYFVVSLFNDNISEYQIVHLVNIHNEQPISEDIIGEGLLRNVINSGRSLVIDQYDQEKHGKIDVQALVPVIGDINSLLAVPIMRSGKCIGVLSMLSKNISKYDLADIQMLELIASQTVVALDNATHYQEVLESARLRDTIYLIGQEINARLNPEQVYETIFHTIDKVIPFDVMFLSFIDESIGNHQIRYLRDKQKSELSEAFSIDINEGLSSRVIKSGKTFRCNNSELRAQLLENEIFADAFGNSMIFVPLIRDQKVMGILSVQAQTSNLFNSYHITLLELIAPYVASALENSILFSRIENLAITDELSGVYNRHYFNKTLKREFERSQRYKRPLSLLILDIDNFKEINDQYGHICGDEVIHQFGELFKNHVRESDIIARFGGDEFVVIMPETTSEQAKTVAEKFELLCNEYHFTFQENEISITASIGLAEVDHLGDVKPEDLIHKADYAMYQAKKRGRNQIFRF
jgi:diguanylate cyclase (GGDEF)-like protein